MCHSPKVSGVYLYSEFFFFEILGQYIFSQIYRDGTTNNSER